MDSSGSRYRSVTLVCVSLMSNLQVPQNAGDLLSSSATSGLSRKTATRNYLFLRVIFLALCTHVKPLCLDEKTHRS